MGFDLGFFKRTFAGVFKGDSGVITRPIIFTKGIRKLIT